MKITKRKRRKAFVLPFPGIAKLQREIMDPKRIGPPKSMLPKKRPGRPRKDPLSKPEDLRIDLHDDLMRPKHRRFDDGSDLLHDLHKPIPLGDNTTTYNITNTPETPGLTHPEGGGTTKRKENKGRKVARTESLFHPRGVHRTIIETGRKVGRATRLQAKLGGTVNIVTNDTKMTTGFQSSVVIPRKDLDHSHGFNSTHMWFLPGAASPSVKDVLYAAAGALNNRDFTVLTQFLNAGLTSSLGVDRRYASLMSTETMISLHNQSAYLPQILKIHMIRPKYTLDKYTTNNTTNPDVGIRSYLIDLVNKTFAYPNQQAVRFGLPALYLHTTPNRLGVTESVIPSPDSDNYKRLAYEVNISNKASLTGSVYFRENFEIIDTTTKRLEPNDTWIFTHRHHYGSGIDIDALKQHFLDINLDKVSDFPGTPTLGNDIPMTYMFMIESKGIPCSVVAQEPNAGEILPVNSTYQGTSPGTYCSEFKTKIKFARLSNGSINYNSGFPDTMSIRSYVSATQQPGKKEKFVLASDIVETFAGLSTGKAFVPILSDQSIVGAVSKAPDQK